MRGLPESYAVRWLNHPNLVNPGMKFASTHALMNSPNDADPAKYYCKENFFPRNPNADADDFSADMFLPAINDKGEEVPAEECFFCQMSVWMKDELEYLETLPRPDPRGFSGSAVLQCITKMKSSSAVIIPLAVRATTEQSPDGDILLIPNTGDDWTGILLYTRVGKKTYNSLLDIGKRNPNIIDRGGSMELTLTRIPYGKGYTTSLTVSGPPGQLSSGVEKVWADCPDIQGWGKNPPGQNSSRTTLNINYVEAEHRFKTTLWFQSLCQMLPHINEDWEF